jgi:hypothetical protein
MIDTSKAIKFNQTNLQDFSDCRKRFYLKHVQELAWPAAEAEPILENEKWMRQGSAFHHMVHQFLVGVPENLLSRQATLDPLRSWWDNFLNHHKALPGLQDTNAHLLPEYSLSAHIGKFSLLAKFDLLVISPDASIRIYDWKTAHQRPKRATLERRMQTIVYPLVVSLCEQELLNSSTNGSLQISMNYWFTDFPDQPEVFIFDQALLARIYQELETLLSTISRLIPMGEQAFLLTDHLEKCIFCIYRSLCERGSHGGAFLDSDQDGEAVEVLFDFEQIGEIEY